MAKQKNKQKEPEKQFPQINISNLRLLMIPPEMADLECQDFNCSGNFLTNLAFAPKKIRGNLTCVNNKKITGELNPLNQFHLGAGRFDLFNGPESSETNRPVIVSESFITDLGVYKDPKIYDCTVETTAAPEKQLTAVERSKRTSLKPNANNADVADWLKKIWVDSGPGMHRAKDLMVSYDGIKAIEFEEGVIFYVYDDAKNEVYGKYPPSYDKFVGNPTIGIGHLIRSSEREKYRPYLKGGGKKLTLAEAWLLKIDDAIRIMNGVKESFTENAKCTQTMFDAIVSWAFNTGADREYRKVDRKPGPVAAIKKMNVGDYKTAANYMFTYNKRLQTNLNGRRERETKLFKKNGYVD